MPLPYVWGWAVVAVATVGLLFALGRALRGWNAPLVKSLGGWWLATILLVPAQIPNHTEHFAPALFVGFFEAALQRNGSPDAAWRILAAASVLGVVLGLVAWLAGRARRQRQATAEPSA
jgi:hypothetical protein